MKWYDVNSPASRDPARLERFVTAIEPYLQRLFRPRVSGLEHIPGGPVLYVGNHSGGALTPESYIFFVEVYRAHGLDGVPYGLAHSFPLRLPGFHQLFVPLGAVRASHDNAARVLEVGGKLLVFPGGDIDSLRPFHMRNRIVFGSRRGYVRLALTHGLPIVPFVAAGAHATFAVLNDGRKTARLLGIDRLLRVKTFPVTFSLPWGLTVGPPPAYIPLPTDVWMEILPPMRFARAGEEAAADRRYVEECHHHVLSTMQSALTRLAAARGQASILERVAERLRPSRP
ncbi:MAG: 1-acyl-sn-glycerol-3-phosphate acyltransferase [Candidatus Schekmanbacteria bacterium]|nr:1-acyl-sn-glycerol-3-phosphate acyltransferase [Candidatus Schekmanbacteria bacterium]